MLFASYDLYINAFFNIKSAFSLLIFIHWLRASLILKVSAFLTPYLKIIGYLLYELL